MKPWSSTTWTISHSTDSIPWARRDSSLGDTCSKLEVVRVCASTLKPFSDRILMLPDLPRRAVSVAIWPVAGATDLVARCIEMCPARKADDHSFWKWETRGAWCRVFPAAAAGFWYWRTPGPPAGPATASSSFCASVPTAEDEHATSMRSIFSVTSSGVLRMWPGRFALSARSSFMTRFTVCSLLPISLATENPSHSISIASSPSLLSGTSHSCIKYRYAPCGSAIWRFSTPKVLTI